MCPWEKSTDLIGSSCTQSKGTPWAQFSQHFRFHPISIRFIALPIRKGVLELLSATHGRSSPSIRDPITIHIRPLFPFFSWSSLCKIGSYPYTSKLSLVILEKAIQYHILSLSNLELGRNRISDLDILGFRIQQNHSLFCSIFDCLGMFLSIFQSASPKGKCVLSSIWRFSSLSFGYIPRDAVLTYCFYFYSNFLLPSPISSFEWPSFHRHLYSNSNRQSLFLWDFSLPLPANWWDNWCYDSDYKGFSGLSCNELSF